MWDFSQITIDDIKGVPVSLQGQLDPLFTDDTRLSEAADLIKTMLDLAREVHDSNRRLGLAPAGLDGLRRGTVEAALSNLITYRNQLENRLAQRFMDACQREVRLPSYYTALHHRARVESPQDSPREGLAKPRASVRCVSTVLITMVYLCVTS
jgi:hypothetical protein